jgi:hypothetical protein
MRAIFIEVWPRWVYLNWPTLNHKAKKHKCHIYLATAILAIHLGYRAPLNPVFSFHCASNPNLKRRLAQLSWPINRTVCLISTGTDFAGQANVECPALLCRIE